MNGHIMLKMFRNTTLAVALFATSQLYAAQVVDQVVAVVDSSVILKSDLDQAVDVVRQQLQQQGQTVPPEQILRKNVLDQLILRQVQVEQVKRFGIQPDPEALNNAVSAIAKQEGYSSLETFQQHVDSTGAGRYALLREQVAEDLNVTRLRQQQVMSRIKISDRDVDNFLKSPQGQAVLGSQVRTLHVRIAPKSANTTTEEVNNVAAQVKQALNGSDDVQAIAKQFSNDKVDVQGIDMGFRALADIPADLAARVSGLEIGQTTDLIPANDGLHVLKLLERKADDKKALVNQYSTRHILIQPSEVISPEDAKQRIDQIYQRLQQGADFSELAATYSADPGSARNGGSLGWVTPGVMVPEFETVMKNTPVGQISQPFQTQYGWHILKVEDTRQVDMTNEYQRRMARQILGERQFDAEVDGWLREIRANAYVDIKDPALKDD
ncbi:peptidylprolyl isomerase [Acinetobacter populi]|jgi:peptidyl-prolyl cis-trans isomerase SurA|uniref:peptidylprolyl isomerase n=1 Tax=Acinetobacter populi TaxID=1582270 RepID=UPI003B594A8A